MSLADSEFFALLMNIQGGKKISPIKLEIN